MITGRGCVIPVHACRAHALSSSPPSPPRPSARATPARADAPADDHADFTHILAQRGLHDVDDERVNAYGQITGPVDIFGGRLHAEF